MPSARAGPTANAGPKSCSQRSCGACRGSGAYAISTDLLEDDVPKLSRPIPETTDELLETGLLDSWYLVCRDVEIGTKPIGLKRLNRNIVLWRNREGKVEAVDDFCPHRGAQRCLGPVCDGEIACEHPGVQANGKGVVTATPPQPDSALVWR